MKKTLFAICLAAMSIGGITILSANEVQATAKTVVVHGHGDGHCTKCGLRNGRYRCPAFNPIPGHPTDCRCGHSKNSHSYTR